jgi:hypothetical protein
MAAIKARKQADGSTRYTAVVRIRRQGKVLHQEAKTFAYRSAALRRDRSALPVAIRPESSRRNHC